MLSSDLGSYSWMPLIMPHIKHMASSESSVTYPGPTQNGPSPGSFMHSSMTSSVIISVENSK